MADGSDGDLPWTSDDSDATEEVELEEIAQQDELDAPDVDDVLRSDDVGTLGQAPTDLDDFSRDDYLAQTTTEYQGLAESIREMDTETVQMQAVAAPLEGIDSGIVGFEDVTGTVETLIETPAEKSDLPLRVVSGLVLVGLLVGSAVLGGAWFVAFIVLAAVVAVSEFYSATRRSGYKPIALFGLLAAVSAPIAGYRAGAGGVAGAVVVSIIAVLVLFTLLLRKNPLDNAAVTIFGIVWIPGMLGFASAIIGFDNSAPLIIGLVLIVAAVDTGSFFAGRTFGKTPMAPVLSPNKTWEGLAGGAVGAVVMTLVISLIDYFEQFELPGSLWLALALFVTSPLGDLAESMIKRSLGIKDMGSIIPGHGGLLDRVDALLFAVPVGYFVFQSLGYLSS